MSTVAVAALLAAIALAIGVVVFGKRRPDYRHLEHTISELGERGAADGATVSFGLFLPVGLVLAAVWFAQRGANPAAAALAGVVAIGYVGAAFFRCDRGSPLHGSAMQAVHNLAGGLQYVGGALVLWRLGTRYGPAYEALALVVVAAIAFLSVPSLTRWRGLAQRAGEAALFGGLAFALEAGHGA